MRLKRFHPKAGLTGLLFLSIFILACHSFDKRPEKQAEGYNDQLKSIRDTVAAMVEREEIPSMAVAVAKDGKVIWKEAFGWADKEKNIKATPETVYCLGSMSKSICATGVMTLVEQGKTGLNDRVNDLIAPARLTGYAADADEVRVLHVLNMSAGIPHGWTSYDKQDLPATAAGKDELFERYGLVTFPPGKVFNYANYSMGVGDMIMERVSGKPVEVYMEEAVFQPLGMSNSMVTYKLAQEEQQLATPYSSNMEPLGFYQFFPYGGGGYWSSAGDIIRYALFHLKQTPENARPILSEATADLMHNDDRGPSELFALGWFNDGVKLISNGSITGYNSCLVLVPSASLAAVVLTNKSSNDAIADQIAFSIVDKLAPDLPEGMTREKYMALYETPYAANPELAGNWAGQVRTGDVTLPVEMYFAGSVRIRIGDEPPQMVENAVFSPAKKLEGDFPGRIPVPEFEGGEPVTTWLNLYLDGDRLVGYAAPLFSNDKGSFSYGAYMELKRKE